MSKPPVKLAFMPPLTGENAEDVHRFAIGGSQGFRSNARIPGIPNLDRSAGSAPKKIDAHAAALSARRRSTAAHSLMLGPLVFPDFQRCQVAR